MTDNDHRRVPPLAHDRQTSQDQTRADSLSLMVAMNGQRRQRRRCHGSSINGDGEIAEQDVSDNVAVGVRDKRGGHQAIPAQAIDESGLGIAIKGGAQQVGNLLPLRGILFNNRDHDPVRDPCSRPPGLDAGYRPAENCTRTSVMVYPWPCRVLPS